MRMNSHLPTMAFIDGANIYGATRELGVQIDWTKMLEWLRESCPNFVRANYYSGTQRDNGDFDSMRPLFDFLSYNGYNLVTKPVKTFTDSSGKERMKGNMDVELVVDMIEASIAGIKQMILFSGDGDFRYVLEAVQRRGTQVIVVSTMNMVADEIRRQADQFVELKKIIQNFTRLYVPRNEPIENDA